MKLHQEAQRASRILAQGIALGRIHPLRMQAEGLPHTIVSGLSSFFMPQAYSLPLSSNPIPRAVPWASMP